MYIATVLGGKDKIFIAKLCRVYAVDIQSFPICLHIYEDLFSCLVRDETLLTNTCTHSISVASSTSNKPNSFNDQMFL